MTQRSIQSTAPRRSTLDRAIFASIAAMLGMNLFVLSQQLEAAPQVAAAAPTSASATA